MSSNAGKDYNSDNIYNLPDSDAFWRLLLGRKYDNMEESERTDSNLLDEFYRRDGDLVDDIYDSKVGLVSEIQAKNADAEKILMTVWAERKWQNKSPGEEFKFEKKESVREQLNRLSETNFITDHLDENLIVIWTRKQIPRAKEEDRTVRSHLDSDWSPLFARETELNQLEIRGSQRRVNQLTSEFADQSIASKILKEVSEESVLDDLSKIFSGTLATLDLIEVRFAQTRLPNGSQLTLRNLSGVQQDLQDENINPDVVSPRIASKISYLKFKDQQSGNIAKINIERRDRGFSFEMQASYIGDEETEAVKTVIEDNFGISFNKVYPYHLQHQTDRILHQILSGSIEAYNTYYDHLENKDKKIIEDYIQYSEGDTFDCWSCYTTFEYKPDTCDECGNDSFQERDTLSIDHNKIFEDIADEFSEFSQTIDDSEWDVKIEGLQSEKVNISSNSYVRTRFRRTQNSGKGGLNATQDYKYEYFVHPLSAQKPSKISQYLLNTIFITYGTAYDQELSNFGSIHLIDLLRSDDCEHLFLKAVEKSHRGMQDRYRKRSKEAVNNLRQLQSKVDTDIIEQYNNGAKDKFLDNYTAKKFEKDVFHVLKSVFTFTERWGREGKKETDGCLVIPKGDSEYWVGGYDPKLTTDPSGYNIRSTEKDKVAYYILEESDREYIKDVLKRGDPIDAHIFISDIFREGQFETTAHRVKDWFSITKDSESKLQVPIIFIRIKDLIELYDIFNSNYVYLLEYPGVMSSFRNEVINQLSTHDDYIDFDKESCDEIKKKLLRELDLRSKDEDIQNY